eukprot:scaffold191_cov273-Chaetoceros_neogracile.AAC.34
MAEIWLQFYYRSPHYKKDERIRNIIDVMFDVFYSPDPPSSLSSPNTRANYHPPGGKIYIVVEQKAGCVHDLRCSVEGDTASLESGISA